MATGRLIRRAAPIIVIGVAGAVVARRRADAQRRGQITPPPYPPPVAEAGPVIEVEPVEETSDIRPQTSEVEREPEPEPEPELEPAADEQPTVETTALEHAPWLEDSEPADTGSVTEIVDDLLAPQETGNGIEDATVVEAEPEEDSPDDGALAEAARAALAGQPEVGVEVRQGVLTLSGEVERPEAIHEIERLAADVPGIRSVSSLLHLPGTPPPAPSEHR